MSDLYLVAHKVRGEAAFDIACQMICPNCHGVGSAGLHPEDAYEGPSCNECEGLGYWWIIPTSGHRAYPWLFNKLSEYENPDGYSASDWGEMPDSWPDHYPPRVEPKSPKRSLLAELGLAKPQGHPAIVGKVNRRI